MDGEAGQSLQSSYVGSSGRVVDAAYDLGKENLVTVTDEGTISLHRRLDRHEEWVQIQEWETPKQQPLSKVCIVAYSCRLPYLIFKIWVSFKSPLYPFALAQLS